MTEPDGSQTGQFVLIPVPKGLGDYFCRGGGTLAPVVDRKDARAIIAFFIAALHDDALH